MSIKSNSSCTPEKTGLNVLVPDETPIPADGSVLELTFSNPPNFYRGKPFWSWNGKLEKDELIRQARIMKEMGFGGYFMHSRVGLNTEYLGDEWFSLINAVADESERIGMEGWLYDEDRWPSGSAGGLAAINPGNRMKYVRLKILKAADFAWDDSQLAAFACNLDGHNFSGLRRLGCADTGKIAAAETVLVFTVETMSPHPFFNGQTYIDTMDPAPVADFIRITHEEYRKRCGNRIGRSIKGIFTDEPHRGMLMSSFSSEGNPDGSSTVPWTPRLPELFKARFGADLVEHLPDIFLRRDGKRLSPFKWQYVELIHSLFLENYMKQVLTWCHANGMKFTGHVLHEDNLVSQVVPNGSMLRNYEYMDTPGIDALTEGNRCYWNAVQVRSVARQLGKRQILSELYGCTGWQMNFESYKASGDWQSLLGVNLRCQHLSWFTMKGEAKRDYPASMLHQSSWWPQWKNVESYFARLHVILERGEPECSLLVLDPVESVWAQIGLGWCKGLSSGTPEITELENTYRNVFHWLQESGIDFDYGNEDIISRYGKIIEAAKPILQVGNAQYGTVLVAGMETIRGSTLDLLEHFAKAGGKIVVAGTVPTYVDAAMSSRCAELAKNWTRVPLESAKLASACRTPANARTVEVLDETGEKLHDIYIQIRHDGETTWAVVVNLDRDNPRTSAQLRLRGNHGAVEEWNLMTGERSQIAARSGADGCLYVGCALPPCGSRVFRRVAASELPMTPNLSDSERVPVVGPFDYRLDEPNVCLLDRARWRIDGGEWRPETEMLRIDHMLREILDLQQRGGQMVQPWFAAKHLPPPKELAQLELDMEIRIDALPQKKLELVLEDIDRWTVYVNGTALDPSSSPGFWIDIAFKRLPIPAGLLKVGANKITVRAAFRADLDIENMFLVGDFGVRLEGSKRIIGSLPEKLAVGSVVEQGLPFYGAGITYFVPIPEGFRNGGDVALETPHFEAACIMVGGKNDAKNMIAWQPYKVSAGEFCQDAETLSIHAVLTRRNTFGPVHEFPVRMPAYHPGSFRTKGDSWREEYVLLPNGLLDAPVFIRQKRV